MFCPFCGAKMIQGAVYCTNCGRNSGEPLGKGQEDMGYEVQRKILRQKEMKILDDAYAYFSAKKAYFDEYDRVCKELNHYSKGARNGLLVWGAILATIALLMMIAGSTGGIGVIITAIFFALIPGAMMISFGLLAKSINRSNLRRVRKEYADISLLLCRYYLQAPEFPIGWEYVNPKAIQEMREILRAGRCDTIKESFDIAFSERRQRRMGEYISLLRKNTAEINQETKVSTLFIAGNYFK